LEHVIAGKAVALLIAQSEEFRDRQQRSLDGARAIGEELLAAEQGLSVWSGGTDVHLVVADLRESELDGKQAQDRLEEIGITANRNAVPFDPRPPMVSSGVRIGTPALASRGLGVEEFRELGAVIRSALCGDFESEREELSRRCAEIAQRHPLYPGLGYRGETPAGS
jgi:glycine hydroxymethyltransferase